MRKDPHDEFRRTSNGIEVGIFAASFAACLGAGIVLAYLVTAIPAVKTVNAACSMSGACWSAESPTYLVRGDLP